MLKRGVVGFVVVLICVVLAVFLWLRLRPSSTKTKTTIQEPTNTPAQKVQVDYNHTDTPLETQ